MHGIGKSLDPDIQPGKQVVKSIAVAKRNEISQIKLRLGQGRAELRCKMKTFISKPLMQAKEKPPPKVLLPNTSKVKDIAISIPNFATPQVKPKSDRSTKMIDRKTIQDVGREISIYPDPVHRPPS